MILYSLDLMFQGKHLRFHLDILISDAGDGICRSQYMHVQLKCSE
jgi:hypothetical protein